MVEDLSRRAGSSTRRALGYVGLSLTVLAADTIVAGLPWQIRFPLVVIAVLYGPGVPLMIWLSQLPAIKSVTAGIGLDVSLLLLAGELMVMAHVWQPDYVVSALLASSAVVSAFLLTEPPTKQYRGRHV